MIDLVILQALALGIYGFVVLVGFAGAAVVVLLALGWIAAVVRRLKNHD